MSEELTPEELELARERLRQWPLEERKSLTRMSEQEAKAILLLTALLDITPIDEIPRKKPTGAV